MPVSAPPPSWANLRNKPNTVAGFGITDMATQTVANATNATAVPWSGVSSKPTTVAGLGLSDFNAQAIAAQANATFGAVGTYGMFLNSATSLALGSTRAGSSFNKVDLAGAIVSAGLSGTWRNMGAREDSAGIQTQFLRIA